MTLKAFARAIGGPAISSWPWEVRIPRGQDLTQAQPLARPLLDFLIEHGNRPEFTFRFRWQKGSIAFWDNRSTKHIALGDTGPFRRLMRRVQICGDKPV